MRDSAKVRLVKWGMLLPVAVGVVAFGILFDVFRPGHGIVSHIYRLIKQQKRNGRGISGIVPQEDLL